MTFQSTFPRGERRSSTREVVGFQNFNPRSLVGNDDREACFMDYKKISIHVPSWGTTGAAAGEVDRVP